MPCCSSTAFNSFEFRRDRLMYEDAAVRGSQVALREQDSKKHDNVLKNIRRKRKKKEKGERQNRYIICDCYFLMARTESQAYTEYITIT